ncbi:hypothetical protein BCR33DRAFT_556403 [Rhizoclosmatium globosum]|uniref:SGNH hydrolase-type esterase domain-containing protein n=1 Tax=Rhizoclosmatium globosum TaxID=329046 RepID=A0A1Y2CU92_9FUNG|nr:hypothetical protein BCR33DRAFT_556403 [Rhizoclosmatium globosum]|eukprot:ORY49905.1 hypothetical protein BCR33DRAFT_556403 [Rhizoclosmatium globosum]
MKDMIIFTKQKHPRTKILLITPAPMLEEEPRQRTQVLRNAVIQLASELNVGVLDSWKVLLGPSGEYNPSVSRFYYDGNFPHQYCCPMLST